MHSPITCSHLTSEFSKSHAPNPARILIVVLSASAHSLPRMLKAGAIDQLKEPLKLATGSFPRFHFAWDMVMKQLTVVKKGESEDV